jgi:hypothetical protein
MTKSSIFAPSNSIGPWTMSSKRRVRVGRPRPVAPVFQLVGGAIAVVGAALRDEPRRQGAVPVETLRLEVRTVRAVDLGPLVPVEAEPPQSVEDRLHHFRRRALEIGIFNPQDERPAEPAREQPVEQRRAGAPDVQIPGRRRREPDAGGQ